MADIEKIVEATCGCTPTLLQHVVHWVYSTPEKVIKVSSSSLGNSVRTSAWLSEHGYEALPPEKEFVEGGFHFYIYSRGENSLSPSETAPWMGVELNKVHDAILPAEFSTTTYRDFVAKETEPLHRGVNHLPSWVHGKIMSAQELDDLRLVHGDPHAGNIVRVNGKLKFIDWDYHMMAPKEHDLAIVKFGQLFGAKPDLFNNVSAAYGSYCPERLKVMLNARLASSTIWLADEIVTGVRENNAENRLEIDNRIARLEGDDTVILKSSKITILD